MLPLLPLPPPPPLPPAAAAASAGALPDVLSAALCCCCCWLATAAAAAAAAVGRAPFVGTSRVAGEVAVLRMGASSSPSPIPCTPRRSEATPSAGGAAAGLAATVAAVTAERVRPTGGAPPGAAAKEAERLPESRRGTVAALGAPPLHHQAWHAASKAERLA